VQTKARACCVPTKLSTWCSAPPKSAGSVENASSAARSTAGAAAAPAAPLLLPPAATAPTQARPTETLPPPSVCSSALRSNTCKRGVLSSGARLVHPAGAEHCNCALRFGCSSTHLCRRHHTHVRPHLKVHSLSRFRCQVIMAIWGSIGGNGRPGVGDWRGFSVFQDTGGASCSERTQTHLWRGLLRSCHIDTHTSCKFQAFWVA
jgi:hypothetical protein